MKRLPIDDVMHRAPPASPLVEATLALVHDLVRRHYTQSADAWSGFVTGAATHGIGLQDFVGVEAALLASGYRFAWSAAISVAERPDIYQPAPGTDDPAQFYFDHADAAIMPQDADGREQLGTGDNVVRHARNVIGTARYIRSSARVLAYLTDGVPPDTIAIIDDSGGTLTAPIIDRFAGVVCAGGSVRSHLGILTREYNIPCFMNARVNGIRDGDRIELEVTAAAKTAEDYQAGVAKIGRIWRLDAGSKS